MGLITRLLALPFFILFIGMHFEANYKDHPIYQKFIFMLRKKSLLKNMKLNNPKLTPNTQSSKAPFKSKS